MIKWLRVRVRRNQSRDYPWGKEDDLPMGCNPTAVLDRMMDRTDGHRAGRSFRGIQKGPRRGKSQRQPRSGPPIRRLETGQGFGLFSHDDK